MATPPDFSPGQVLTAQHMEAVGLWKISSGTLSTVTNDFTSVFSSDYDNYLVTIDNLNNASATTRAVLMQLLSGSTPATTNYRSNTVVQYGASTLVGSGVTLTGLDLTSLSSNTNGSGFVTIEIFNPNKALNTFFASKSYTYQSNVTAWVYRNGTHYHETATAYNGFRIVGATDNLSGNVTIYGMRK